jgi:hypothetical protein
MPNTRIYSRAFNGGEIAPDMFGRLDDTRYQAGAAEISNMLVLPHGPAARRPGLQYVNNTKSDGVVRLIPFSAAVDDSLVVEMGAGYARFHSDGATVAPGSTTWQSRLSVPASPSWYTGDVINTPLFFNWSGNTLTNGEPVVLPYSLYGFTWGGGDPLPTITTLPKVRYVSGGTDDYLKVDTIYYVRNRTASGFNLSLTPTSNVLLTVSNSLASWSNVRMARVYRVGDIVVSSGVYYYCIQEHAAQSTAPASEPARWTAVSSTAYEIPTTYTADQLFDLHYTQSNDVLTLVHPSHPVRELRRYAANRYVLANVSFTDTVAAPTIAKTVATPGQTVNIDKIVSGNTYFECLTNHNFEPGDPVYVSGVSSCGVPDGFYTVHEINTTQLKHLALTYYTTGLKILATSSVTFSAAYAQYADQTTDLVNTYALTSIAADGVESQIGAATSITNLLLVAGALNTFGWISVPGALRYNVYKKQNGLFGYIGQVEDSATQEVNADFSNVSVGVTDLLITKSNHGFATNDMVRVYPIPGLSGAGQFPTSVTPTAVYFVEKLTNNEFYIKATVGGAKITNSVNNAPTNLLPCLYRKAHTFVDDRIAPDMGQTPPLRDAADLNATDAYPGAVAYFEQRRCFSGSNAEPQTIYMTRSGTESDLAYTFPSQDTDRIKFRVAARERNRVRHLLPLGNLVMLTNSSEWRVTSVNTDVMTPTSLAVRPQSYIGANNVQPAIINSTVLFCAERGGHVRELGYDANANGFRTGDMSLRATHLFDKYEIVDLAYGKAPSPVAWFVSTSGKLLGLTYIPEEQVGAWHQHATDGTFESVCCIPEGEEDRVYAVVKRTVNGVTRRHIERMAALELSDLADCTFLDAFKTFDLRNTTATTVSVSGASYVAGATVTVAASASTFVVGDVGSEVRIIAATGTYGILVTTYTSGTSVQGTLISTLPTALQATATTSWAWARNTFSVPHLPSTLVQVFGDGKVQASATASGAGLVTTAERLTRACIGLGYTSRLVTLPVMMQIDGAGQGRTKNVSNVWVKLYKSAGMRIGPTETESHVLDQSNKTGLRTEEVQMLVTPAWQKTGQIWMTQTTALPLTVLGITVETNIGG